MSIWDAKKSTVNKFKGVRVLRPFDNVTKPWFVRQGMDDNVFLALQNVLVNLKDKNALIAVSKECTGFTVVGDDFFEPIRIAMKASQIFGQSQSDQ